MAAETEVKLKIRESELLEKASNTETKEIFEGETASERLGIMEDLKCIAQLFKMI